MISPFVISFLLPVILSLLITPLVIRFANMIGATDKPGERKVHTTVMPRIGGLGIFLSAAISIIIVFSLFPEFFSEIVEGGRTTGILVFCFVSLFSLGFWDDLKPLSPEVKFGVQFALAALIYIAGFKISNITNPLGMGMLNVEIIDFPLTILWIVGITNAFNLIDGLDGLTSGVATIACISIFSVAAMSGEMEVALLSLIVAGSLVGFLRYNFNPGKIFLGESGSLIIGFSLALLSIQSTAKLTTGFALLFPLLVLALPITDTLVSMLRRLLGSFLKNQSEDAPSLLKRLHGMFSPDKSHIHHRLLSMGLSHRGTVLVLYGVSILFAFSAFLFTQIDTVERSITIAAGLGIILILGIKKLHYHEMAIFNNGLMIPFYEKWILNKSSFIRLADILFITASFTLSYLMVRNAFPGYIEFMDVNIMLAMILCLQFFTLWISGLYREKMSEFGIGSALHITASVAYASASTGFLFLMMNAVPMIVTMQFIILNFYFLLTFVLGFRMAYQALSFWFNRAKKSGESVLIYGAGENGSMVLHKILSSPKNAVRVLGFLDDNPELEGKLMYGYPILGGHWKLTKAHQNSRVDSIYICDEGIKCENLKRLKETAYHLGISIKKLNINFSEIDERAVNNGEEISEQRVVQQGAIPAYTAQ